MSNKVYEMMQHIKPLVGFATNLVGGEPFTQCYIVLNRTQYVGFSKANDIAVAEVNSLVELAEKLVNTEVKA